ncbi:hypothetical protein V494_02806 [Pseudogymnoascus sp. VKM F-4513 (FW-928)]|nr:hypothetical protein V494_02806 [Pseudogymnoascus sp. VKM F-4513 (FW-928)]
MDPLSITASIIAVVQLTGVVIKCLNDVKDTSKDRAQCAIEISNVSNLLVQLMWRLEEGSSNEGWYAKVQALAAPDGPINQYMTALEQLQSKLTSDTSRRTNIGSVLSWKLNKEEVANILMRIERLKSLTQIALEMDHFKLSQALKADTTVIATAVVSLQESQVSEQYRATTDWLSSTDFPAQQSDFISRRQEGTGQWFVVSPEFTNWLRGTKQDLFCPGIPGAGKTMIAAIAVDHIWKTFQGDNVGVAYIYCNYKRQETQTATELLAAILKQLVQERPLYGEPVTALYKLHADRRTRPSLDEICTALRSVLINYSKAYIIVDALDECTDSDGTRSDLLLALRSLQANTSTSLMATSRFISWIEQSFQGSPVLEIQASEADVKQYVTGQLHRLPNCVRNDPALQTEIEDGIALAVDGMFLLARLHVESLRGKMTKKAIRSTLRNLPRGSTALNKAYDEAIERIESQLPEQSELAKTVLSWISYAMRQLTTKELTHALAVEEGESELDEDNILDMEDIISVCAGLVAVDEESDIIRLVHYTTQEYFEGIRETWNPIAQEEIASTCLTYLSCDTFGTGHCYDEAAFESRITQNPFLDYAARYWGEHALPIQQEIKGLALQFLCSMSQLACSTQIMLLRDSKYEFYGQDMAHGLTGIHVTALFGLVYLLKELIHTDENGNCMNIDARDSLGKTPLSCASEIGHEAIVKLLVERDDVVADSKDSHNQTPLSRAAAKELIHTDENGNCMNIDARDSLGKTPLSCASEIGHEAIVKLLVERDDVVADSRDSHNMTPLSWAAERGHEAIVKLLVEREDVVADSKDGHNRTPLSHAASGGHEAIAKLLVGRDDVVADSKDSHNKTPLSWAADMGNEAIVKLLLERDDVVADSKDGNNRTPLSHAAEAGHEAIVKLLVERDDVVADSKDGNNRTPLLWAARYRNVAVVRMFLRRNDVDPNSQDKNGCTPLLWTARSDYRRGDYRRKGSDQEATIRLLLEKGNIVSDSKDNDGRTPLSIAAEHGREGIVQIFLGRNDVDANSEDEDGYTPLWWATEPDNISWRPIFDDDVEIAMNGRKAAAKLLTDHLAKVKEI